MAAQCDVDLLAGVPLFADLSGADLKRIASVAKRMRYRDGAVVVEEGSTGGRFFVIQSGAGAGRREGSHAGDARTRVRTSASCR